MFTYICMYIPKHVALIAALVLQTLLPMSVVDLALLIVLQDLICIIDIVKLGNCIWVVWVFIRMVFNC